MSPSEILSRVRKKCFEWSDQKRAPEWSVSELDVLPAPRSPLELRVPSAPLNTLLRLSLLAENRALQRGLSWPWGLSALVIARRPVAAARGDAPS